MTHFRSLADIRREYGELSLDESYAEENPISQFKVWFEEVLQHEKNDPTAMVLSTVDEEGLPDSRVVLLKELSQGNFVFYTNYQSTKAMQLEHTPYGALNFYWAQMARQVRVRGKVERVSDAISDAYFATRPVNSQLSAMVSQQSQVIESRDYLEHALNTLIEKYGQKPVQRPLHWGGYQLIPDLFEFWQGRDNRLHDRIQYYRQGDSWLHCRLAP